MLTEKDYCDYDTCVALKELGYIGQGRCYYNLDKDKNKLRHFGIQVLTTRSAEALNFVLAVHLYEAQKWLREEKEIGIFVSGFKNGYVFWVNNILSVETLYQGFFNNQTGEKYKSYEEALLEGVRESIKLLEEEK